MVYLNGEKVSMGSKVTIATLPVDQEYNPESEKAQSGKAVAQALTAVGGTWERIVDITTTEEATGIVATAKEFPNISKSKEFITRIVLPKTDTIVNLGAIRLYINREYIFRLNSNTTSTSGISEIRCHTIIADTLLHTVGTEGARGHGNVVGNASIFVGNYEIDTPQEISANLNDATKVLPVGTKFIVYGKVEG
ncbi:MAG: hypothetical protein IJP21_01070 [Clostridia bacterium]|nr:hypothetical protein [Clostridia bacterium]